jgi:hypothetical protein
VDCKYIVTCRGVFVTYTQVLDWMIGFIDNLYTQFGTTGSYSAIAIPALYRSLLHTDTRVLGLHELYPDNIFVTVSLSLQITHEVFFAQPNSFLAISSQLFCQLRRLDSILFLAMRDPCYIASGRIHRKHRFLYCWMVIHWWRDMFTKQLRNTDHGKQRCSIAAHVCFHRNVFTKPLPSNELFRLSGIISQYNLKLANMHNLYDPKIQVCSKWE